MNSTTKPPHRVGDTTGTFIHLDFAPPKWADADLMPEGSIRRILAPLKQRTQRYSRWDCLYDARYPDCLFFSPNWTSEFPEDYIEVYDPCGTRSK